MSRRSSVKRKLAAIDPFYQSRLISMFVVRVLKNGKKSLAQKIIYTTLDLIGERTNKDPLSVLETAVRNVAPVVEIKARRIGGSVYQVPTEVNQLRGTNVALRWIIKFASDRPGKSFAMKLANEIIDASNQTGSSIRCREQTHKMAEANKAFAHFKY